MIKATTWALESKDADATVQNKEIMSTLTDAITLAMQCFHDMNSSRHQTMKKDLHRDYSALCNNTTDPPTSEYLFGDLSKGCPPRSKYKKEGEPKQT